MIIRAALTAVLSLGLLVASPAAEAQQPGKVYRIGLLATGKPPDPSVDALRDGLHELGYVEGQNLTIELRWASASDDRLPEVAAELVALKVDVIVTQGTAHALAAKRATATIPIVIAYSGDPVGSGLVANLGRPGGNVTGLANVLPALSAKRLEFLKAVFPEATRVGVLHFLQVSNPLRVEVWKAIQDAAPALSLKLLPIEAASADQYQSAFAEAARVRAQVLTSAGEAVVAPQQRSRIAALAIKHHLPTMYGMREFAEAGGLLSYGASIPTMHRRAAYFIDKILKGARPGDLPFEQPTKFELVINLKTASALGLKIPPSVLARADQVIE